MKLMAPDTKINTPNVIKKGFLFKRVSSSVSSFALYKIADPIVMKIIPKYYINVLILLKKRD
jgi:hypothetical protein